MNDSCRDKGSCGCDSSSKQTQDALDIDGELKIRPRSPTLLNLSWLRDRLNRVKFIKERLSANSYDVDPEKTAKALLNKE